MGFFSGPLDSPVLSRDVVITPGESLDFIFFRIKGFWWKFEWHHGNQDCMEKGSSEENKGWGVFQRKRGLWENGAMWGVLKKKRKKKKRKTRVFRGGKWKSLKEGTLRRLKIGRRGRRERGTSWRFREKKGKEKQNRRGRRAGERKGS